MKGKCMSIRSIHPIAGLLAMGMIALFMLSTLLAEASGSSAAILMTKRGIVMALPVLILALAATGGSGYRRARKPLAGATRRKLGRMRIIAANGLMLLVPCAVFLMVRAGTGRLDGVFFAVQVVELVAGAVNLALLAANFREGLKMRRR